MSKKSKPVAYKKVSRGFVVMAKVKLAGKGGSDSELVERPISGWFFARDTAEQYLAMAKRYNPDSEAWIKQDERQRGIYYHA